jgi:hypothetical protein
MYFTKKITALLGLLFLANFAFSQTPFWKETFANQLPPTWKAIELAGNMNASSNWKWTKQGGQGGFSIGPIMSASAADGWMIFDSDLNCNYSGQRVWLQSPKLDLSARNNVWLQFQSHYRRFNDLTWVEVSTDSTNWTAIPIFVGLTNNQWGNGATAPAGVENPQTVLLDLTQYAANQQKFWFAFHFRSDQTTIIAGQPGCGYSWQIDDVELLDFNPLPPTETRLGDFWYSPASFAQPVSQIKNDTFPFFADISNEGSQPLTNVVLKAEIKTAGGSLIFVDSLVIPTIPVGFDSTYFTPDIFIPDNIPVGDYTLTYSTYSLDAPDNDMTDNTASEDFVVTDVLFSKEREAIDGTRASFDPEDYLVGNLYQTSKGWVDEYKAVSATFHAFKTQADGNLAGDKVGILFLEVKENTILPDWSNFNNDLNWQMNPAFEPRSILEHTFTTNALDGVETVMLEDFDTGEQGVPLKPGNRYLLCASYEGDNNVIYHGFNDEIQYFQISSVLYASNPATGLYRWYLGGYGPDVAHHLRLTIDLLNTTDEKALPDNVLTFFPNPASDKLTVSLDLEKPSKANVTLADLNGRVILIDEFANLSKEQVEYNVTSLPSGTYLIRVATTEGTKTKKFVVQR